jgi:hypothetical protein
MFHMMSWTRGNREPLHQWNYCDAAAASFVRDSSDLLDEIHTKSILSTLTCYVLV